MGREYRVIPNELTVRATTCVAVAYQLLSGTAGISLAGVGTVELHLTDNVGGTVVETTAGSGRLSIVGTASGSVSYTPGTGSLVAGSAPYRGYFKLISGTASWFFVPEDSELTINVRET